MMKKIMLSKMKPGTASHELPKSGEGKSVDSDAKETLNNFLWSEWCKDQGPSDVNIVNFLNKRSIGIHTKKNAAKESKKERKDLCSAKDYLKNIETRTVNGDLTTESVANTIEEGDLSNKKFVYHRCEGFGFFSKSCFYIATSNDGKYMAACQGDHTVKIIEVSTGTLFRQLTGFQRTPWSVAFHPTKPNIIAAGCLYGEVRIFSDDRVLNMWHSPMCSAILSLSFHPTEPILAVASASGIFFWRNCESGLQISAIFSSTVGEHIRYVRFSPCGQFLLTAIRNPSCLNMGNPDFHSSIRCSIVEENYSHNLHSNCDDELLPEEAPVSPYDGRMTPSEVREFNSRLEVAPSTNGNNRIVGYPDEVLPFNSMNYLRHQFKNLKDGGFSNFEKGLNLTLSNHSYSSVAYFCNMPQVLQAIAKEKEKRKVLSDNVQALNSRTIPRTNPVLPIFSDVDEGENLTKKCADDAMFTLYREIYYFFPNRIGHQSNLLLNFREFWLNKAHQLAVQEYTRGMSFMNHETGISYELLCALNEHNGVIWSNGPNAEYILSNYDLDLIGNGYNINFHRHRSYNISKPISCLLPFMDIEYMTETSEPRAILFENYHDSDYARAIPTALKLALGDDAPSLIVRNPNNITKNDDQTLSKILDSVDTTPVAYFSKNVHAKSESKPSNNINIALDSLSNCVLKHITDFTTFSSHVGCIVKYNMVQNRHQSFDSYTRSGEDFSPLVNTETLSKLTASIKEQSEYYFLERSSEKSKMQKRIMYNQLFSEANKVEMEVMISGLLHGKTGLIMKSCEDLFWVYSINPQFECQYIDEELYAFNEISQYDGIHFVPSESILPSSYLNDLKDVLSPMTFDNFDGCAGATFIYEFQRLVLKYFTFSTFVCLFYNDPLSIFAWLGVETENYFKRLLDESKFRCMFPLLPKKNLISAETLLSSTFGESVPKFTHCGLISRFVFGASMVYKAVLSIEKDISMNGAVNTSDHMFHNLFNMLSEVHDAYDIMNRVMDSVKILHSRKMEFIHNIQALDIYIAVIQSISIEVMNRVTELQSRNIILNHAKDFKVHNIIVPDTLPDHCFYKIFHYTPDPSNVHESLVVDIKPLFYSRLSDDVSQMEKAILKYQISGPSNYEPCKIADSQSIDDLRYRSKWLMQKLAEECLTDNEVANLLTTDDTNETGGKYRKIERNDDPSNVFISRIIRSLDGITENIAMICEFLNWDILSPFYRLFGPRTFRPVAKDIRDKWVNSSAYITEKGNSYRRRQLVDLPYRENSVPGKFRCRRMHFTSRVQLWKFDSEKLPNITDRTHNVVAPCIFINNDSCLSISEDWRRIAVLMPVLSGDIFQNSCGVFSLLSGDSDSKEIPKSFGVPLYSSRVHESAMSVAFNHNANKLVIGRTSININTACNVDLDSYFNDIELDLRYRNDDCIAYIVKLGDAGELTTIRAIGNFFPTQNNSVVSINSITWLRKPPYGIVFGTNTGGIFVVQ